MKKISAFQDDAIAVRVTEQLAGKGAIPREDQVDAVPICTNTNPVT